MAERKKSHMNTAVINTGRPVISFNTGKIRENAEKIYTECKKYGIEPSFVTKGFCVKPEVIKAVMDAGFTDFCDSRMMNIIQAKKDFPDIHMTLVRTPAPQEAKEVVMWADCSLQSDIKTVKAISDAAKALGKVHDIFIDIDLGDIRDGIFYRDQLDEFAMALKELDGVRPVGVMANVGCYGSVMPGEKNTRALTETRDYLNEKYGFSMKYASIGGTVAYTMISEGKMPDGINHFRFGEAALFGEDTTGRRDIPGFYKDSVIFSAPVLERFKKPSVPVGELGRDASGRIGVYPDRGIRTRLILAAGRQDVDIAALTPLDDRMIIVGNSSDHMIIDAEDCENIPETGEYVHFRCGYMAMLTACTSSYVDKRIIPRKEDKT